MIRTSPEGIMHTVFGEFEMGESTSELGPFHGQKEALLKGEPKDKTKSKSEKKPEDLFSPSFQTYLATKYLQQPIMASQVQSDIYQCGALALATNSAVHYVSVTVIMSGFCTTPVSARVLLNAQ